MRSSARDELKITSPSQVRLEDGALRVVTLGRGRSWFDTGAAGPLFSAAELVRVVEHSQRLQIGSLEEIAHSNGWISLETLRAAAEAYGKSDYGRYLQRVADGEVFYPRND